jgi:hypothetical protein
MEEVAQSILFNSTKCDACDRNIMLGEVIVVHHYTTPQNPVVQTKRVCSSCNALLTSSIWGKFSGCVGNHIMPSWELQRIYLALHQKTLQKRNLWDELLVSIYPFLIKEKGDRVLIESEAAESEWR